MACILNNLSRRLAFMILLSLAVVGVRADLHANISHVHEGLSFYSKQSCFRSCSQGGCKFENCDGVHCPGGACWFVACSKATCSGGACVFERCRQSSCEGGGCDFIDPQDTLHAGYCKGGGCFLEGRPHPDFSDFVSV
eukprot:gene29189-35228_t